jgi:hypothetical protein
LDKGGYRRLHPLRQAKGPAVRRTYGRRVVAHDARRPQHTVGNAVEGPLAKDIESRDPADDDARNENDT